MAVNRTRLALSGLAGPAGNALLVGGVLRLRQTWQPPFQLSTALTWAVFAFFMGLALLEIPVMLYGLKKIAAGQQPAAQTVALLGYVAFVFFPGVYALPSLLLAEAGFLWPGTLIAATSLLRLVAGTIYLTRE